MSRCKRLNSIKQKLRQLLCVGCAIIFSSFSSAENHFLGEIDWHGFISQSYVNTNQNEFMGTSTDGSWDANEAGLNASWRATNNLQLAAQALYKRTGNAKPKGTRLDYAIIDWRIQDRLEYGMGLRAGRLKNPYGFFNETRDVAATRPSILLAEGIYLSYLRELIHSSDSLGAYGHLSTLNGTLSFDTIFGKPIFNSGSVRSLLGGTPTNGTVNNEQASISRLIYEHGSGAWRAALSYTDFKAEFEPASGEPYQAGDIKVNQLMVSAEFNWREWQLLSEYQWRTIHYLDIFGSDVKNKGIAYYVQLGYQYSAEWSAFIRKDDTYTDASDKDGKAYTARFGGARPAHNAFAKNIVYGLRYEPSFAWSFSAEYHRVNGTTWLPDLENPVVSEQQQYWNLFLLQGAYRF